MATKELEKRLRELVDNGLPPDIEIDIRSHRQWLAAFAHAAARIGAEIEREECAADVETMVIDRANVSIGFYGEAETFNQGIYDAAALIRARSGK